MADDRTGHAKRSTSALSLSSEDDEQHLNVLPASGADGPPRSPLTEASRSRSPRRRASPRTQAFPRRSSGRSRSPRRGRSRSRRPRAVIRKKGKQKGKQDSSAKGKDKRKGKGSQSKGSQGKGKDKTKDHRKGNTCDNGLSQGIKDFHAGLIDLVPQEDIENGVWKDTILNYLELTGSERANFLEDVFQHVEEQRQFAGRDQKNKRIYIGPGRDGSSNDKISIDCKFDPQNTRVTFSKVWKQQGFVKPHLLMLKSQ